MLGGETVALVLRRKLRALVKHHLQRSKVRVHQDIGSDDLGLQFGVLAGMPRILLAAARAAEVVPGPAVKSAFLNVGHVVGNQVRSEEHTSELQSPMYL